MEPPFLLPLTPKSLEPRSEPPELPLIKAFIPPPTPRPDFLVILSKTPPMVAPPHFQGKGRLRIRMSVATVLHARSCPQAAG